MSTAHRLARYAEIRELGAGATGRVVLAEHRRSGRPVVVKHLSPACLADPVRRETFHREARHLTSLTDPNLVRMIDYVETRESAAVVLEAVEGPSLRRLLLADGPCPPEVALTLLAGSLQGLAAAHRRGVVHRDPKPENVLIDATGRGKLADLGIAAPAGPGIPSAGTPPYLAPEQWNGWPATPASDIYAVSALFYETLTGRHPFTSTTLRGLRARHEAEPPSLAGLPTAVRPLLTNGLAKLPALRYRDAPAFLADLERWAAIGYGRDWRERGTQALAEAAVRLTGAVPLPAPAPPSAGGTPAVTETAVPYGSGAEPGAGWTGSMAVRGPTARVAGEHARVRTAASHPETVSGRRGQTGAGATSRWGRGARRS